MIDDDNKQYGGEVISPGKEYGYIHFIEYSIEMHDTNKDSEQEISVTEEIQYFDEHVKALSEELAESADRLERDKFYQEANIIRFHVFLLQDEAIHEKVHSRIQDKTLSAAKAVEEVLQEFTLNFFRWPNGYLICNFHDRLQPG